MIHPYDNSTQTRWDRGELKVQINQPENPRPIGFCDGSPEDVTELLSIAEAEGVEFNFTKKRFKEWVLIPLDFEAEYESYIYEALDYAKKK